MVKKVKLNLSKNRVEKSREKEAQKQKSQLQEFEEARLKNEYITSLINGRYFLARCNMIAEQLVKKKITEKIDGRVKSLEYSRSEYALTKLQAINSMRKAYFSKQDLIKKFKFTQDDLQKIEIDYYDGKIVREEYDESYKKKGKAEFSNT